SKEAKKNRYLKNADADFAAGKYQKAEIGYLNVLKVSELDPVAVRQLGFLYYEQGRLPQAYSYLREAVKLDPENPEIHARLGQAYLTLHDLKLAGAEARTVLAKKPGDEEALLLLASTVDQPKDIQDTLQFIEKARQQDKDSAAYHLAIGTLYLRQEKVEKAEEECRKALAMEPKSAPANIAIGNFFWSRKDLKQADQFLKMGSELSAPRSSRHLVYADFKLKTGHVDEAKTILEKITKEQPDFLPAWNYLMQVAFAEKKLDDCAALAKKILAVDDINYDAIMMNVRIELLKNDPDQALAALQRLSPIYEGIPQVKYQRALAYMLKNDSTKALSSAMQAISLNPDFTDAVLLAADLNIKRGNPEAAIPSLLLQAKLKPEVPTFPLLLANAYSKQKNYADAEAVYRRMETAFAPNREVPVLLGGVLLAQNKRGEARKAFEKSLTVSPGYFRAVEQLVMLDLADKQYASATQRVKAEMERKPQDSQPWLWQATIYLAQKNLAQGEAAILKAIELNPESEAAYAMLVQLYVGSNRYQEALVKLKGILVKKPNDQPALLQIGMLQQALGKYSESRDAYEKLILLNPNSSQALNNLAYLYSEHFSQLDKALEMAQRARRVAPNDANTADTLGWIFYRMGDYAQAIALLEEAASDPVLGANPEVIFHLGMARYRLGQEQAAKTSLQQVVQSPQNFSGKDEARRRLAFLAIDAKTADAETVKQLEKVQSQEPDDLVVLNRLAVIYERTGDTDKAVKSYEAALKKSPKDAQIMIKLARYYSGSLKEPAKALALAKEAHRIEPEDSRITHELARMVYNTGDFKWASSLFQESARKISGDANLIYDLALSDYALGNLNEAQANIKNALQMKGSFSRADEARRLSTLIEAYQKQSTDQPTIALVQQTLAADPNNIPALMISANLQKQKGNAGDAAKIYEGILSRNAFFTPAIREKTILNAQSPGDEKSNYALGIKAREAFPDDPDVAKAVGILSYRKGEYQRAVQLLRESARQKTKDAEIFYYLGLAHLKLKENKESKEALQQSLSLNLSGKMAEEAKRVLSELK
ncbi:MAG: tetratricopeptide repeat protein, partial [Verrucomicrobiota bacterium]